jgi:hypothetical protein
VITVIVLTAAAFLGGAPQRARRWRKPGDLSGAPVRRAQPDRCECVKCRGPVPWNVLQRLLAALTLFGMRDINAMNGLKMALVGVMTITAIAAFVVADVVRWPEALPMLVSSVVGGYVAAHAAQRLDQRLIKGFIVVLGAGLTAFFFWRGV